MEEIFKSYKSGGGLHHAYLVEGSEEAVEDICRMCEEYLNVSTRGNPDFWREAFLSFSVEDSRRIKDMNLNKKAGDGKRVFVLYANTMILNAQNALLKILEEPFADTHFFIISPSLEHFIPTVKSRMITVRHRGEAAGHYKPHAFVKAGLSKRMEMISKVLKDSKNDEDRLDKGGIVRFVDCVTEELREGLHKGATRSETGPALEELIKVRSYLFDPSASVKQLLEHIAMVLPSKQ